MPGFDGECFGGIQVGHPDIAGAIANKHPVYAFGVGVESEAFIINADLFGRLEIIVNHHFLTATNQSAADLYWSKPVSVDVPDHVVVEKHGQICSVLWLARNVADTSSRNCSGLAIEH